MAGNEVLGDMEKDAEKMGVDVAKSASKAAMNKMLDTAKDESRKVAIKFTNNTTRKWSRPRIFLDSGAGEDLLPLEILADGKAVNFEIHKKKWTFSGIAGVITYQWKDSGKKYSLALMFRSPMIGTNAWNAVIYSEDDTAEANLQLFKSLTKETGDSPMVKGDNNYSFREFGPYTVQGAMSSSGTAKLNLIVKCTEPDDEEEEEEGAKQQKPE